MHFIRYCEVFRKTTHIITAMRLELKELWLQEQLSRCLEECLFVGTLVEFLQPAIHHVNVGLSRL